MEVSTPDVSSELLGAVLLSLRPGCTYHTKGNCMYPNTIGVMECIPSLVLGYTGRFLIDDIWPLALCASAYESYPSLRFGGLFTRGNVTYSVTLKKSVRPWTFQTGGISQRKL